ncbi:PREDICTED: uncharacterized protein LOC109357672 isoform X2 [Lupinus angustifolius]|uniref:uncharacterized protein LOC109357672 isoform X2 n=1 Tax=Lupinus angustifolius TaxID=3871 RepID=UPI00092E2D95|nr:PREDICTED: uncharacterized protein LOC109357672 isoform X2 [Lupinus angustifolius]
MSPNNELGAVVPTAEELNYTIEFRSYNDDAWYTVAVFIEGSTLRVKYLNFSDENDDVFKSTDFKTLKEKNEFKGRFRQLSKQLQDNECRKLVKGVKVCASHSFTETDFKFYDAVVDAVQVKEHSTEQEEELCLCAFVLFWLHGPIAGNLTAAKIENICIVQPKMDDNPSVVSFLKIASESKDYTSSYSSPMSNGVSGRDMVAYCIEGSNNAHRLGFFERLKKANRCARRTVVKVCSPEVTCHDRRTEDTDLGGIKTPCMILVGNLDRELCSSTVTEFLHEHTSVSPNVFIFPSLSSEIYTRGAILLDSEKDFQKLCVFLSNPNCMITSSAGRPWVIIEKLVGLKKIKASIRTLLPTSKKNRNSGTNNDLKVVRKGTKEFEIASNLRDLFLAFSSHQERLYKRLALEEAKIYAARSFLNLPNRI